MNKLFSMKVEGVKQFIYAQKLLFKNGYRWWSMHNTLLYVDEEGNVDEDFGYSLDEPLYLECHPGDKRFGLNSHLDSYYTLVEYPYYKAFDVSLFGNLDEEIRL